MFVDKAKIYIKAGNGGDGIVSFRREKYVPQGGPAGGDGGKGGDVIFEVDEGLRTLMDFRYQRHFKADSGEKGRNKSQNGANASHLIVRIPPGTTIFNEQTGQLLVDMTEHGQQAIIARGGRGGRGNIRFATANNPAPDLAENGEEGQELNIVLELKVIADVGLVGLPSVGKSTLLSVVSAAKPKIGAYPFTTITPNLGVVTIREGRSFVMADLPGLIEGAHQGVGLGHEFLRHVERTRLIVHVVDMNSLEGRDPFEDWLKINEELKRYSTELENRPQIIAANKMDMPLTQQMFYQFSNQVKSVQPNILIIPISSVTRAGVSQLLHHIADKLDHIPNEPRGSAENNTNARKIYTLNEQEEQFHIVRENDVFVVHSAKIEQMMKRMQLNSHESIMKLARIFRRMGLDQALRERGVVEGTIVRIGKLEFEFVENNRYW